MKGKEHPGQEWYRNELDRRASNIRYHRAVERLYTDLKDTARAKKHRGLREWHEKEYESLKKLYLRGELA